MCCCDAKDLIVLYKQNAEYDVRISDWSSDVCSSGLSSIRSELLETRDFVTFHLAPLKGAAARNKGMALFPRKIGGRYAMIARHDNESLHLIMSDDLHEWGHGEVIVKTKDRQSTRLNSSH